MACRSGCPTQDHESWGACDTSRFLDKVELTEDCWNWKNPNSRGYGIFSWYGRNLGAHRVGWYLHHGSWPEQELDHLCRNRACVNPDHLEDVDHKTNVRRGTAGSKKQAHCKRGHDDWYVRKDNGERQCRTCGTLKKREYRAVS